MDIVAKNSPTSYHLLRLTHVAFVPGFLTSLVGLSRCRTKDIHFDSGADLMYRTTSLHPHNRALQLLFSITTEVIGC